MTIDGTEVYVQSEGNEIQEVPDGYVVYQSAAERVHFLNPTAVIVYELCDGRHDLDGIAAFVANAYELRELPVAEVGACIESLVRERLVRLRDAQASAA